MKKIIITIISLILASMMLVGCADKTTKLSDIGGEVAGNGTFAVEKGNYVYFINGKEAVTSNNEFGEVEKASLVRVNKSDLKNASGESANVKIETVIPKLFISASYKTGFYMYGNYVYYATPSDIKDKKGNIQNSQTLFYRFNLESGKTDKTHIAVATDNASEYRFVEKDGVVYLAFVENTKVSEEESTKKLLVYNADTRAKVYESFEYQEMLMAEDNSKVVYLTKFAYDDVNKKDLAYQELYKYVIGEDKAGDPIVNGSPNSMGLLQGVTFSLIKNNGQYLIYKQLGLDTSNQSVIYKAINSGDDTITELGGSNTYIDAAFTSTSYIKSLEEVYYVDASETIGGLVKFNYKQMVEGTDMKHGRTLICKDVKGTTYQFIEGDYMYFSDSEGIYYRCDLEGKNYAKLNASALTTSTEWYAPRVIKVDSQEFLLGVYAKAIFKSYVHVIDITGAGSDEYKENLEELSKDTKENVLTLSYTRIGKMTSQDKEAFDTEVENYEEAE